MSKIRVAVYGTIGKCVYFDPQAGERAEAAVEALAQAISEGVGGTIQHRSLQGLQVGDDHPQYAMWQATESIQGQWDFQTIPLIQGETLAEYIEDVVGHDFFDFLQDTSSVVWTYFDTDGEIEANVPPEFVEDTVGAMLTNSASVFLDYGDSDGSMSARVNTEWSPLWGQNHTWADNAEVRLGAGGDLRLYQDGTDSFIRNDTGVLALMDGATEVVSIDLNKLSVNARYAEQTPFPWWIGASTSNTWGDTAELQVRRQGAFSGVGGAPAVQMFRMQGTVGSPAAMAGNVTVFALGGSAYNTGASAFVQNFVLQSQTLGTQNASNAGCRMLIQLQRQGEILPAALVTALIVEADALRLSNDNHELQIGASQDLRQYHDGTNSIIENDTGNLILRVGGELALEEVTTSTGAVTCTLGTNAPAGVGTTTPTTWMTLLVGGTTYFIPLWT